MLQSGVEGEEEGDEGAEAGACIAYGWRSSPDSKTRSRPSRWSRLEQKPNTHTNMRRRLKADV